MSLLDPYLRYMRRRPRAPCAWILIGSSVFGCGGSESRPAPRTANVAPAPTPSPPSESTRNDEQSTSNDEQIVAGMRQGFRECYQIGLWNNPHQGGNVELVLKLDPRGRPATVTSHGGAGLDRMVVDCLVRVARRGSFAPPTGDGNIVVPIKLSSDRRLEAAPNL